MTVAAVIDGERRSSACSEDRSEAPSAQHLADKAAARVLAPRNVPNSADHHAVTDVVLGIAFVTRGVERIGVAELEGSVATFAKGVAEVVDGMRPSVVGGNIQPALEVVAGKLDVQPVVAGEAVGTAPVD